jgi:predicted nucleotidyltransferase
MTEIQAGNNFSVSTRFMQEMHKAATNDNTVDAKELARLVQVASEDANGLTDDEKSMLMGLFTSKLDTTGLSPEEKVLFDQIKGTDTSQEVVDQNIQALKSVSAHENDPNSLNFSKLQLVSESKSFLSKASFGLFGGTNKATHGLSLSDGNIPTVANPTQTTGMTERREIDRDNLISMMGPLEQELTEGLKPDSDIRQRLGAGLGLDPNSEEVTAKIEALSKKITDFKQDPQKSDWTASSDLTVLMNSYAQNPPTNNPRINSAYMSTLLGSYWNSWDATSMENEQKSNLEEGNIQVPASVAEISETLQSVNELAKTDAHAALDKASTLLAQLDKLKETNLPLYEQVLRGKDESAVDLLRGQVSDLKKHLQDGGAMGQPQMAQLNNLNANLHQLQKTLNTDPPAAANADEIAYKRSVIDNPNIDESMKAIAREELAALEAQSAGSALPAESQAQLAALKTAVAEAKSAASSASASAQESASSRSNMIADLEQAESTLANLLTQHGISDAGRTQLQGQLDATRAALTQLKNNQEVKFEKPEQEAALNKVLQNLQKMKPAPVVPPVPVSPTPPAIPIAPDLMGGTTGDFDLGGNFDLAPPLISAPKPFDSAFGITSPLVLNSPSLLSLNGTGSTSSLLNGSNSFSLYSPSFGYGGYSSGLGGFDLNTPSLSFPSYESYLNAPSSGASGTGDSSTTAAPRPVLSNVFLEGIGEDPAKVKPLSPEQEQGQSKALATIAEIQADPNASPEAKAAADIMKQLVQNPNGPINVGGKSVTPPPGSFDASLSVLETYQDLKKKGISTGDAEVVFMIAARGIQGGQSPVDVAKEVQQIAQSGSTDKITQSLQDIRVKNFVRSQESVTETASKLQGSALAKELIDKTLPDFVSQVQAIQGGESVTTVDEALKFLKDNNKDTTPSYVVQLMQSPNFKTHYDAILLGAQKKITDLNDESKVLIDQVNKSGMVGGGQVKTLDEAITALGRSTSPQAADMLLELQALKTRQDALNPEIAGIQQLNAVRLNYETVQKELTTAIDALGKLPSNPARSAQIEMLKAVQTELQTTGKLTPGNAARFAEFKFKGQMSTAEAVLNSDPRQSAQGRQKLEAVFTAITTAATPAQKDAAFGQLIQGLEDQTIFAPRGLAKQNELLTSLGLPPITSELSFQEFMSRLKQYTPSKAILATITEQAVNASAQDLAKFTLSGEPTPAEIAANEAAYIADAMATKTDPESIAADASSDPIAAALSRYTNAIENQREQNYNLPPDQQAAAWQNTLSDYQASNAILDTMYNNISASIADLSLANDNMMVANGYPPLSGSVERSGLDSPKISQKAQELVDKADDLATALLAPVPAVNGEQFLGDLLNKFINIIRDLDYKTRQLVLQQLAQKMVNNAITQFYKDKLDDNNKHHQESLQRMQENFKAQITQTLENSIASQANSTQGIAAMSGQVTGANLSGAMDKLGSTSAMVQQMFEITDKMSPPLSDSQKQRILTQVNRVMAAAGTPDLRDDQMALNVLSNDLSVNRFNR